jgi:uncharacterized protein
MRPGAPVPPRPGPLPEQLPEPLRGLLRPAAYPHPVQAVTVIETQLSWVLLAGERAYKIKRPVLLPFVDLRSPAERHRLCHEELRLNRRFAPQLYLEVCPITLSAGQARIGGAGPAIEYAVVMRAFDRSEELDRLVRDKNVTLDELAAFGRWLARLQRELPRWHGASGAGGAGSAAAVAGAMARNVQECAEASAAFGTAERIHALGRALAAEASQRARALEWRAAEGRVRECHADLHLSNVVRIDGQLVAFDCLEFEPAFRWIDVAQDAAFLCADLLGYGEPRLKAAFLDAYLAESGDYHACVVLPLYQADRALVRAKVLALQGAARADALRARHEGYLEVAERSLEGQAPCCLMMTGLPGSGKSWLAARLAIELPAVTLRSDLERKRLAGIDALARSGSAPGGGLYGELQTAAVYERLEHCAAEVLGGRAMVIVDANYGQRRQRAALAQLCRLMNVPLVVLQCQAPLSLLRQRIGARLEAARDASEADLAVLERQLELREPIEPAEGLTVIKANTALADVVASVLEELRLRLGRAGGANG